MRRSIAWLYVAIAAGPLALAGPAAQGRPPGVPDETPGAEKKADAKAFPRTGGVYRSKRRTENVGSENRDVYDYLAFTGDGEAYFIEGNFHVAVQPTMYHLIQPSPDLPGANEVLQVDVKDQPAYILKWISDPEQKMFALHDRCEVKGGSFTFAVESPGGLGGPAQAKAFKGQAAGSGLKVIETSTTGGRTRTEERTYEFEPVEK
jgi:hypothetical protein